MDALKLCHLLVECWSSHIVPSFPFFYEWVIFSFVKFGTKHIHGYVTKSFKTHTKEEPSSFTMMQETNKIMRERLLPNYNNNNNKMLVQNISCLKILCFFIYASIFKGFFNDEVDPMFFSILWSYSSGEKSMSIFNQI
jgi:hypothetical protein